MTDQSTPKRIPWKPIEPLSGAESSSNGPLTALEALRTEWQRHLLELSQEDRLEIRRRSLRKLSIETGILERIYDIDWGLTLTLVAEGFAREIVERAGGGVDERTLHTLRSQMQALELVLDFVRDERTLTAAFIKELHGALTRTQSTYRATDTLERAFDGDTPHGEWKKEPNHVLRSDGSVLEYTPPEHVAAEIDRLVALYEETTRTDTHPVIQSAWLHHRFVQIHPFADGNGRVARALTLLVLQNRHYAPMVVDRWHRGDYLKALDAANDGDLRLLVKLFTRLESAALAAELERPVEPASKGLSLEVARTLADQLAAARQRRESAVMGKLRVRAVVIAALMTRWFEQKRVELSDLFRQRGLREVELFADTEMPPDSTINWWFHRQIVDSARTAGHYADLKRFAGWSRLRIRLQTLHLRFVASLHGAGREAGAMAVTTFAILGHVVDPGTEGTDIPENEHIQTTADAFRFVHTESPDDLQTRSAELEELLDEGLSEALAKLLARI